MTTFPSFGRTAPPPLWKLCFPNLSNNFGNYNWSFEFTHPATVKHCRLKQKHCLCVLCVVRVTVVFKRAIKKTLAGAEVFICFWMVIVRCNRHCFEIFRNLLHSLGVAESLHLSCYNRRLIEILFPTLCEAGECTWKLRGKTQWYNPAPKQGRMSRSWGLAP